MKLLVIYYINKILMFIMLEQSEMFIIMCGETVLAIWNVYYVWASPAIEVGYI